jgi:predicted TIM-barrel fold metal-dependent hydrolase
VLYRTVLPEEFRRIAGPLGVTATVAVEASPWIEDNQWLLDLARREPVIAGVVGHLDPEAPEFPRLLERFAANPLFKGIRLNQGRLLRKGAGEPSGALIGGLRRMASAGLQIDVLGGPAALAPLVRINDAVPELRIVIDHMPFDAPRETGARGEYEGALRELESRKPVYAKVSGVLRRVDGKVPAGPGFYRRSLEELWSVFGPARLLYASNWPVSDRVAPYRDVLEVVRGFFAGKGEEASARFFRGNAAAAYRVKTAG